MIGHDPQDGDCLVWPSYLLHDVDVNRSDKQRISIAFNAVIERANNDNVIEMPDATKS
jgi:ectoine hydroxylase-related dioxygenase (phytanoyl-CoA dioxygenase family)